MTQFPNNVSNHSFQTQQAPYSGYNSYNVTSTQREGESSENTLIQKPEEKKTGWGTYVGIGLGLIALGSGAYVFRKQIGESVSELGKGFQKSEPVIPSTPKRPKPTVEPFKVPEIDASLHHPVRETSLSQTFNPHTYDEASLPKVFVETRDQGFEYRTYYADPGTSRLFKITQQPKLPQEIKDISLGGSGSGLGVAKDETTGNLVVRLIQDSTRRDKQGRVISNVVTLVGNSPTKFSPAQRDAIEAYANSAAKGTHFDGAFYRIQNQPAVLEPASTYHEELGFNPQHFFNDVQAWHKQVSENKPEGYISADDVLKQVKDKGVFIKHNEF
jgi:hypothetical protein